MAPSLPSLARAPADRRAHAADRLTERRAEASISGDDDLLLAMHLREAELEAEIASLRAQLRVRGRNEAPPATDAASVSAASALARDAVSAASHVSQVVAEGGFAVVGYWDKDLVCRYASRNYLDWFGIDPCGMIGRHISAVLPRVWERNQASFEAACAGIPQQFDQELEPPGFPRRVVWTQCLPDIDPVSGEVLGIAVMGSDVTEMREAQAARRQSEEQFASAFYAAPIGMALVSLEGRWLQVNKAVCEMFGYTEDELRTRTFQELTYPEDLPNDLELIQSLLAGDINGYELGKRYVARDGRLVHAVLTVSLLRHHDGRPRCFLSQIVDISVRLRIEARDARRADALTLIATGAPLPVVLEQLAAGIEGAHPSVRCSVWLVTDGGQHLHVAASASLSSEVADWINASEPPAHALVGGEPNWEALRGGAPVAWSARDLVPATQPTGEGDGDVVFSPASRALLKEGLGALWALPVRGTLGNLMGLFVLHAPAFRENGVPPVGVVLDVASAADLAAVALERWHADESLMASRRRYEDLVQSVPGIVWEAESDTFAFTFVSAEAERLLGYPRAVWLDEPTFWFDHIHPEDRDNAVQFCEAQTALGLDHRFEYRMIAADGRVVWLQDTVGVLPRPGKTPILRGVLIDITDRKRAEDEVRTLNAGLEERIAERTAQLTVSNRELAAFTYAVSHDLRAPLRRIDTWSRALAEDCAHLLDATGNEHLMRVLSEAGEMTRIVDDLLRLSRYTQSPMRYALVDLASVARGVARRLSEGEPERHVELRIADTILVDGDPGLLTAAVTNLVENAWKFTSNRENAEIEVGALSEDGACGLFVRDNGAGFDPAYANKLFTPFQRLHKSSEFPGFGIGLATVQRIIARHGGRIWGEGSPGAGATFSFSLPRVPSLVAGTAPAPPAGSNVSCS